MEAKENKSVDLEIRVVPNGKGGISIVNKEHDIFANVPVNTKLYEKLKLLLEGEK